MSTHLPFTFPIKLSLYQAVSLLILLLFSPCSVGEGSKRATVWVLGCWPRSTHNTLSAILRLSWKTSIVANTYSPPTSLFWNNKTHLTFYTALNINGLCLVISPTNWLYQLAVWEPLSAFYKLSLAPCRFSSSLWLELGSFGHINTKWLSTHTEIIYIHMHINTRAHLKREISQKHMD